MSFSASRTRCCFSAVPAEPEVLGIESSKSCARFGDVRVVVRLGTSCGGHLRLGSGRILFRDGLGRNWRVLLGGLRLFVGARGCFLRDRNFGILAILTHAIVDDMTSPTNLLLII